MRGSLGGENDGRQHSWNWRCSSGCPPLNLCPHQRDGTKAPISSREGAWWYFRVPVAWAAPSVCVCVIKKGKTINMELDSTGPAALKVTDAPLLWLHTVSVRCKQQWPKNVLQVNCRLTKGGLIICACRDVESSSSGLWPSVLLLPLCSFTAQSTGRRRNCRCGREITAQRLQ